MFILEVDFSFKTSQHPAGSVSLTVAFPAVSADGQLVTALREMREAVGVISTWMERVPSYWPQRRAVERRLDGVSHLSKSQTLEQHSNLLKYNRVDISLFGIYIPKLGM